MGIEGAVAICESCRRRSVLGHVDWWGRCPACRRFSPGLPGGYVISRVILMVVVAGAAVGPLAKTVAILVIWPLGLLNTVIHEATHALTAKLLGWRVYVVAIGKEGPLAQWWLGDTLLVVHKDFFLLGGSCYALPDRLAPSRGAIALYVAAPMTLEILLAAAVLPWISGHTVGGIFALVFAAGNLLTVLQNAWPRAGHSAGTVTDGRTLLDLWIAPDAELAGWRVAVALGWLHPYFLKGRSEEAFQQAERALAADPTSESAALCFAVAARATGRVEQVLPHVAAYVRTIETGHVHALRKLPDARLAAHGLFRGRALEEYMRASLLVALDRLEEVLAISERGAEAATSEETRALWQGCVALALMMTGKDLDRAEAVASWAYERLPWVPFIETAWGMARIERGDFEDGLAAFERARTVDREGSTRWLQAAWSAAAGRRDLLDALKDPGAWPACRRRAERALSGSR